MYIGFMTTIGEVIKERREALRMTQRQLGSLVGVTHQHIGAIERGHVSMPGPELMGKLADALQVAEENLLHAAGYLQNRAIEAKEKYAPTPIGPEATWAEIVEVFDGDEDAARRFLAKMLGNSFD